MKSFCYFLALDMAPTWTVHGLLCLCEVVLLTCPALSRAWPSPRRGSAARSLSSSCPSPAPRCAPCCLPPASSGPPAFSASPLPRVAPASPDNTP